jgi:hypothetical protein
VGGGGWGNSAAFFYLTCGNKSTSLLSGGSKMPKSWTKSKTIILNGLTLAASLLTVVAGSELIADYPRAAAGIVAALAAINVALRFVTHLPVA